MNITKIRLPEEIVSQIYEINGRYSNQLNEDMSLNVDINNEIDINQPVSLGMNALHILSANALPDSIYENSDARGCWQEDTSRIIAMIDTLLDLGADIDSISNEGYNALDYALISSNSRFISHLLDRNISTKPSDNSGTSPLEGARNLHEHGRLSDFLFKRIVESKR